LVTLVKARALSKQPFRQSSFEQADHNLAPARPRRRLHVDGAKVTALQTSSAVILRSVDDEVHGGSVLGKCVADVQQIGEKLAPLVAARRSPRRRHQWLWARFGGASSQIGMHVLCKLSRSSHVACLAHVYVCDRATGSGAMKCAHANLFAAKAYAKEMRMNVTDHCNAIHKQANQMRSALWLLVFAAIAAYLVWTFGGAPWWVYALLFTRSVFGFARALIGEPATPRIQAEPCPRQ
jgi:hypothetical protein